MVRACNSHAPTGSDTLRGFVGRKGLEWYFTAVGQVRFLASQDVMVFLVGCHVSKTWEYKEHLNGSAACCRLCGQLYLGESLGSLTLVRARRQPLWGDWHLL